MAIPLEYIVVIGRYTIEGTYKEHTNPTATEIVAVDIHVGLINNLFIVKILSLCYNAIENFLIL